MTPAAAPRCCTANASHRRGQRPRQQPGVEAGRGEDRGRIRGEIGRSVPRVEADDDRAPGEPVLAEPCGQTPRPRGAPRCGSCRSGRRAAVRAARPSRSVSGALNRSASSVVGAGVEQRLQLGGGRRVDLVGDPGLDLVPIHHRLATSSMPKPGEVKPPPTKASDGCGCGSGRVAGMYLGVVGGEVAERFARGERPGASGVGRDAPDAGRSRVLPLRRQASTSRAQSSGDSQVDSARRSGRPLGERADPQAGDLQAVPVDVVAAERLTEDLADAVEGVRSRRGVGGQLRAGLGTGVNPTAWLDEAYTTRPTPWRRAASKTWNVPSMLLAADDRPRRLGRLPGQVHDRRHTRDDLVQVCG